ncbi:NADH-cytochrome b5 reductase-like [Gigantopelta aegis]|uniref:NADH-cytochrome b5 reductase-like n=1 Tax=Gigantopelta aegis TaxID=1735272 RepID=UPI001B88DF0A|nr:NADH-cytochrome b5 reductase-like [Gigantopelta aegis]
MESPDSAERSHLDLPLKPVQPSDEDCCGNGCVPCVFDIYDEEVKIWERECKRIRRKVKQNSGDALSQGPPLSTSEYRQFQILSVTEDTADTHLYRLALPEDVSLGITTGQHMLVRGYIDGEPVTRQYTPVSDVNTEGYFELLIKLYPQGKLSKLVRTWKVGRLIDIRGPLGNFCYKANQHSQVYMLAAGTGIAPMAQVIQTVLSNPDDETILRLVYACRTYRDIHLKQRLNEWAGYWNFSVLYALSKEDCKTRSTVYRYGDAIHFGRITASLLSTEIAGHSQRSKKFLICGSKPFEQDMVEMLNHAVSQNLEYFRF